MIPTPDLYLPYTLPCASCARPTWYRAMDTHNPICLGCAMEQNRDAVNCVPRAVRQALMDSEADAPRES